MEPEKIEPEPERVDWRDKTSAGKRWLGIVALVAIAAIVWIAGNRIVSHFKAPAAPAADGLLATPVAVAAAQPMTIWRRRRLDETAADRAKARAGSIWISQAQPMMQEEIDRSKAEMATELPRQIAAERESTPEAVDPGFCAPEVNGSNSMLEMEDALDRDDSDELEGLIAGGLVFRLAPTDRVVRGLHAGAYYTVKIITGVHTGQRCSLSFEFLSLGDIR